MTDVYAPQSSDDSREFVKRFGDDGTAVFERVGFEDLDFSAIFGKVTTSGTQNAIAYGIKGFTLDYDNDSIKVGYPLQCMSMDDPECFMQGVVVTKDTRYSPAYIEVAVTIISPLVNTTNNWELSVVPVAGFSVNPSATVGISTTSIDAGGDGPFTFTTQTGKLFMQSSAVGGTVVITALNDPKTYLYGRIAVVSGSSLIVNKIYSNATSAVDAWSIQLFDGPAPGHPTFFITGLTVSQGSGTLDVDIYPGSVRDYSGTLDIVNTGILTKKLDALFTAGTNQGGVRRVQLTGTLSSSGTTVTGSGTAFLTEADQANALSSDYNQQTNITAVPSQLETGLTQIISTATRTTVVSATFSNTSIVSDQGLNASAGTTAYRGGVPQGTTSALEYLLYGCRKDSDGTFDAFFSTVTEDGEPDLPSGYSLYRLLARVYVTHNGSNYVISTITQPLYSVTYPFALDRAAYVLYTIDAPLSEAMPNALGLADSTTITKTTVGGTVQLRRAALTGDVTAPANSNATTLSSTAITNKTEKTALVDDDLFLIADSEASFALKKVKNVNAGGGGGGASFPADMGSITEAPAMTFDCGTVP